MTRSMIGLLPAAVLLLSTIGDVDAQAVGVELMVLTKGGPGMAHPCDPLVEP